LREGHRQAREKGRRAPGSPVPDVGKEGERRQEREAGVPGVYLLPDVG
jgi:hypothetical protein